MKPLKDLFLLDPDVVFLNHGSFGACPRTVFNAYRKWQRRLERQPVLFMREFPGQVHAVRQALGAYLGAHPDRLVLVPNVTFGLNLVARSLQLQPGDEILTTDQEYGACNNIWEFVCQKTGAVYIHHPIPLPLSDPETVAEGFWQGVTPKTKVIFLSHITSPTAQRLPIESILRRARQENILTCIDGAHAPGQLKLSLEDLDADFYLGNCHKWMLSPKGAGFVYVKPGTQVFLEPVVISRPVKPVGSDSYSFEHLSWTGTHDPSAALSIPAALHFMERHDWEAVSHRSHHLLSQALEGLCVLTGIPSLYHGRPDGFHQMGVAPLPSLRDITGLKTRLYDEFHVEVPVFLWQDQPLMRISMQGYNCPEDVEALLHALEVLLPQVAS